MEITTLLNLNHTLAASLLREFTYPWEVLPHIHDYILELGASLPASRYRNIGTDVWIAHSAKVAPNASIAGPCIIDENAEIRHCAFIRGIAIIGRGTVVGNSTEIKNGILFDGVQVPHYNYVGDSILGWKAHMGAGAVTSNLKIDKSLITIGNIQTGMKKIGASLGDGAEIGCNTVLNPGTIIGRGTSVYPNSCVRGIVPADHIYKNADTIIRREV